MTDNSLVQLIKKSSTGCVYHRIICDEDGNPYDYEILEFNTAFESLAGVKGSDFIGKRISEIATNTAQDEFDWIKRYSEIAINEDGLEFEQYSKALKKWYKVLASSPEESHFITHFVDITSEKEQIIDMQWLIDAAETLLIIDDTGIDYSELTDSFMRVCKANYAVFNQYNGDGKTISNQTIAEGIGPLRDKLAVIFDPRSTLKLSDLTKLPVPVDIIKNNVITRFSSLKELKRVDVSKSLVAIMAEIEKLEKIENKVIFGEVVMIRIFGDNAILGDFILIMPVGVPFNKDTVAKVYTNQLGIVIERQKMIEKRKHIEMQLLLEREWLKTTLLSIGDGVLAVDREGNVLLLNKKAEKLTGYKQDDAIGKPADMIFNIVAERTRKHVEHPVSIVLNSETINTLENDAILISKAEAEWHINTLATPIRDKDHNTMGVVLVFKEINEQKKRIRALEDLSFRDGLTDLYNRRFFEEELTRLDVKRNLPLSLVMLDVNGLKLTNDAFGHKVGDELLRKLAVALKEVCRADDIIARIGGDEFAVILPKTDSDEVMMMANRINARISMEKVYSLPLSVSSGLATKSELEQDIEITFKNAEDSLYRSKLTESTSVHSTLIEKILQTWLGRCDGNEEHVKRVSAWCASIGTELEMDQGSISDLSTAGLMHDIGNSAIDAEILNKPDILTVDEWSEIKRHPEIGFRILSSVNELAPLAEIILAHHERWDGTGYPKGLKGEEIPLKARILSVVDAYDSMTSYRPYRKAKNKAEAVEEIGNNAGTQFDPGIVKLFVEKILGQTECT
jgi:diguanylate cyclase (GGDEF)-like protein/PAS domain S-box-containing protein